MDYQTLIDKAHRVARPIRSSNLCDAGGVAALIVSESGQEYTGICMDFACSLGFCAEHAAVAEMLKNLESHIAYVVAVDWSGKVLPPCGRCLELMWQLDAKNADAVVILGTGRTQLLRELLPSPWFVDKL